MILKRLLAFLGHFLHFPIISRFVNLEICSPARFTDIGSYGY